MPRKELIARGRAKLSVLAICFFGKGSGGLESHPTTTARCLPVAASVQSEQAHPPDRCRRRDLAVRVRPRRAPGRPLPAGRRHHALPFGNGGRPPAPARAGIRARVVHRLGGEGQRLPAAGARAGRAARARGVRARRAAAARALEAGRRSTGMSIRPGQWRGSTMPTTTAAGRGPTRVQGRRCS